MSESFSVGEIAIMRSDWPEFDNTEVEVVGGLAMRTGKLRDGSSRTSVCYVVLRHDGKQHQVDPPRLRKKRPPPQREAISSWDDVIVWRPKEMQHV